MPWIDRGGSPKVQGMKEERKRKKREEETTKRSRAEAGMSIESVSERLTLLTACQALLYTSFRCIYIYIYIYV